jgi:hypothetical protein
MTERDKIGLVLLIVVLLTCSAIAWGILNS